MVPINGKTQGLQMRLAGRIARVEQSATENGFPLRDVTEKVFQQGYRCRFGFRSAGDVKLAEQHHAFAFVIFHERAVLQTETAVHNRQEIAPGGLFDQHRGDVAAVAASPDAGHRDPAPLNCGAVTRPHGVVQARRENGGRPAPVMQMLRAQTRQDWMVRHARENASQPMCDHAEAKPLLQDLR